LTGPSRQIGAAILWTERGLGVIPVVGFPASDADRDRAADETGRISLLVSKASAAQVALFRHLAQTSPDGRYYVPTSKWIDTVMKAVAGLKEAEVEQIRDLDWAPADISADELRTRVREVLKSK
jgi:hypothetical protein